MIGLIRMLNVVSIIKTAQNVFRSLFLWIDIAIYWVVENIFQLIMDLAHFQLFTTGQLRSFANRIYIILGLVMIFKLMISFFQIFINPDNFDNKENGIGNILKRVVISLVLIVLVPSIFDLARRAQDEIVKVIPKVILAVDADISNDDELVQSTGRTMAWYSFLPFFYYNNDECAASSGYRLYGTIEPPPENTIYYVGQLNAGDATEACSFSSDGYAYRYNFIWATVVGAYLVYVLVTIAVKIAIRAIKFSLCEIIAPIPISSYIDPKQSKQSFDKWVSTSIKVYLDLFIRIMVVYFVIYIFQMLFVGNNGMGSKLNETLGQYDNNWVRGLLVILFIIVGLLQFAKDMPKFVSELIGVPDGFSDIKDMFTGAGWKALGGTAGMAAAPFTTAVGNYRYARKNGENRGIALKRALNGGIASLGRGAAAMANGKGFNDTFWNNVATTTGNSHRHTNKRAINKSLKNNRRRALEHQASLISDLDAKESNLVATRTGIADRMVELRNRDSYLQTRLANARMFGNSDDIDAAEEDIRQNNAQLQSLYNSYENIEGKINEIQEQRKSVEKMYIPKQPTPIKDSVINSLNRAQGLSSVSSQTLLDASQKLSSIRSAYYTGEAMKKLKEEGTKLDDKKFDLVDGKGNMISATYSEVASALKTLDTKDSVTIGGRVYTKDDYQVVQQLFSNAEKDAAQEYIRRVESGDIINTTIEEGIKQTEALLAGLQIDRVTMNELNDLWKKDKGAFYKKISDISKRLETEGNNLQAYERAKKGDS